MKQNLKVIITGATGMVGEGVLLECLQNPHVAQVLVINRKPGGVAHPKLREVLHQDFHNLAPIESQLQGFDACYFCLGISSVGVKEADYRRITYDLTLHVAQTLSRLNPQMVFCYVSGTGTDSTEKGSSMWARVKGQTENALTRLPFQKAYNFRPGFLEPSPGMKNVNKYYNYIGWLAPVIRTLAPRYISTLQDLGKAMIIVTRHGYAKQVLEVPDIKLLAKG
ncbi:NAD-dependent epimerase/dehydratase family protein [Rufibacter latericius]|uniref:NAD-dependent epimerase/dehydratase family protein n=1 Tax=Rufibacter latericius TaxID=2487040 RepID=A0A3M9M9B7_9BACT|nr:NAD-dependent epimerase/dehydratase family protein [Rufibacter latericius]RNI21777.1 NAD-dependent epimerase/dehydratase family protein [Rufibacter latericius]